MDKSDVTIRLWYGCHGADNFGQFLNLGRRFGTSKMHLSPPVAKAAVRSKAVVLLLLTPYPET